MKRIYLFVLSTILLTSVLSAQITWTDISTQYDLPASIALYEGDQANPVLKAWYLEIDVSDTNYVLTAFLNDPTIGPEGIVAFSERVGAAAAINGGFFDLVSNASFSAIVNDNELLAKNIAAVTRSGQSYPVTRAFFSIDENRQMSVDWIYHFGNSIGEMLGFTQPAQNAQGAPAATPIQSEGIAFPELLGGIGGGPSLVRNGQIDITYTEEVFWESGVGLDVDNPRTAVGWTADQRAIFLVVDGRQIASSGADLTELAQMMIDLGCMEAMNLDGGGSTQMAVNGTLINRPEGGDFMRPIPSILAVVHRDSLQDPQMGLEEIIDTEDSTRVSLIGVDWFETANAGSYGNSASLLHAIGDGSATAEYRLDLGPATTAEVFAWWVSAFNRASDTPIIVDHQGGRDTIRVDQTTSGAQWNSLGTYQFAGDSSDRVTISNAAVTNSFVVADAIRIVSEDPQVGIDITRHPLPKTPQLAIESFPNPFNPSTTIRYTLRENAPVSLTIYNLLGQIVATLVDEEQRAGQYRLQWQANALPGGIYFAQLSDGRQTRALKLVLMK